MACLHGHATITPGRPATATATPRTAPRSSTIRPYEPNPRYAPVDGRVVAGWPAAAAELPPGPFALAIDGPAILPWLDAVARLAAALVANGRDVAIVDARDRLLAWDAVQAATASPALADDPDFATLAGGQLADLVDPEAAAVRRGNDVTVVFGPGAALVDHDVLWYADLPKRYAEAAIGTGTGRNLGQRDGDGPGTSRRLFYVDWPLLDRQRDAIAGRLDRWLDLVDVERPASIDGATLRRTGASLATRPFRTRPTFNTVSWGGHWGQRILGMNREARNTGLGYELIAPESGVLIGADADAQVEVPFQLLVAQCPDELLGPAVRAEFGTSFPIRFDYLDTVDGGSLSVHCHPRLDYMQRVFGWPYTQHETYYVMVGGPRSRVFLGLRGDVDIAAFEQRAHEASDEGRPFDIEAFVQAFPATPHQLFAIPAGTPHGSGKGNVVLEVSATPYLYSLRFYDWLRRDEDGRQRPVHVDHAFANLDTGRVGDAVARDLVREPVPVRDGPGWREETLSQLPDVFYEVRRLALDRAALLEDDTAGRFHVLNVVEGDGVRIDTAAGASHDVAYAETIVVPAAVGRYTLRSVEGGPARVVKALVR